MGHIFTDIKNKFKQGAIHIQFIYINIGVFLVIILLQIIDKLFNSSISNICESYIALPTAHLLLTKPWTLITYMFVHEGIWHILFNMLCLYWFGELFLMTFSARHLRGLYILGGLAGGLFFLLIGIFLPNNTSLVGASAAIMAIIVATAVAIPNHPINVLFIGSIKMKYVAGALVLISVLSVAGNNSGGEFAHLGGALAGWLFAAQLRRGHDIVKWINAIFDFFNHFGIHQKPKMKIHSQKAPSDWEYNARKKAHNKEIDRILEKLKQSGYDSLTVEEKKTLFDESKRG